MAALNRSSICFALALFVVAAAAIEGQEWGRWRGPGRDGSVVAVVEERRIEVAGGETWAVPALVPGGFVVRDGQGVMRLAWGS